MVARSEANSTTAGVAPRRFTSAGFASRVPVRPSIGISSLRNHSGGLVQTRTSRTQRPEPRFHFGLRPWISPLETRIAPANSPGCRLTHRRRPNTITAKAATTMMLTPRTMSKAISMTFRPSMPRLRASSDSDELIGELRGETACLLEVVVLQIRRRDLQSQVLLAVLTRPEVADQREQRPHLAALVPEVDAVDPGAPAFDALPPHRLEVVFPVAAARHGAREGLPVEHLLRGV